jgi:hypothetical protein
MIYGEDRITPAKKSMAAELITTRYQKTLTYWYLEMMLGRLLLKIYRI